MTSDTSPDVADTPEVERISRYLAEEICKGFQYHDGRERAKARDAFSTVDQHQFAHLDTDAARAAATDYVEALWRKDALEDACKEDGELISEELAAADWSSVQQAFRDRSRKTIEPVLGEAAASRYAEKSVEAWRNHKTGGDYWTPIMEAQVEELRAAVHDPDYPHKPKYGQSGAGPEAARYALAVELHDMHTEDYWLQAVETMSPYFRKIFERQKQE